MQTTINTPSVPIPVVGRSRIKKIAKRFTKRILFLAITIWFMPALLAFYIGCGLLDVLRNQRRTFTTLDRYFTGNGYLTWLLSPFNLLMDLLTIPFRNRGIYKLTDLPEAYQAEIKTVVEAARASNLVDAMNQKLADKDRVMMFFKWYGRNVESSIRIPEFHRKYKYIRTIGISVFNKHQSTTKHFGPLRATLRVLYNINDMHDPRAYIKVGNRTHQWKQEKLFIFDDTLQHQSCNETDEVRHCLFVDILRPSLFPFLMSAILTGIRFVIARVNFAFYQHWQFVK